MIFVDSMNYLLKYYKDLSHPQLKHHHQQPTIDRTPTLLEEQEGAFM